MIGVSSAGSVEQYVNSVEKITANYAQDMRGFLRSLDHSNFRVLVLNSRQNSVVLPINMCRIYIKQLNVIDHL